MKLMIVLAGSLAVLAAGALYARGSPRGALDEPTVTHKAGSSTGNSNRKGKTFKDGWQQQGGSSTGTSNRKGKTFKDGWQQQSGSSTGNSNRKGKTFTAGWQTGAGGKPPA